jgi:hypothetical protein
MKSKLLFLLSILLCLNLFSQTYIVNDDFESDALGTLPDGWVIRFEGTGNANQKIVESPVKNGSHSFQVSGSSWAANLSKNVTSMPNEVTLEGWMRAENVASGGRCGMAIGNPSVGSWGAFLARIEFYNSNLITYYHTGNSGGYGTQYILQPAAPNVWYHVKIESNTVAETYKVYINGVQASSNTGGPTTTDFPLLTTASQTSVELYGNSMIYFDDVKLYETMPELIAFYPFNGNANDESGNGNNGIIENEATLTTDRFGNPDSAYSFDGMDDYIRVPHSSSLDITGNELTITMWLYNNNPDASNTWKGISKGGYDVGNGYELLFTNYPTSNGKTSLNIGNGGYFTSSFNTYSDQWIMLTGTFNNGVGKVYINGAEQSYTTQGSISLASSTSDLYIGTRNPANNYEGFVKGKIDDIRIYKSALTESQVLSLYNNNTLEVSQNQLPKDTHLFVSNNTLYFNNERKISEIKSIFIYNLLAQEVYKSTEIQNELTLDSLDQGIYILKVELNNGKVDTKKFLIQ